MKHVLPFVLLLLAVLPALALGPHELLLLVNQNSPASLEVANQYTRLRDIPPENVVYLDLPDPGADTPDAMRPEDFTRTIWEPVHRVAEARGLDRHILAWVYSVGFPTRVLTEPNLSIGGLTAVRNRPPDREAVELGQYRSPLFAGPDNPEGSRNPSSSLETYRDALGSAMPLPSMMLGYVGAGGSDVPTVVNMLRMGVRSDATAPSGTVYFVTSPDVRSTARDWQFPRARDALEALRVDAVISTNFPQRQAGIMGIQMGATHVRPAEAGAFRPGSVADHLTSFAAAFQEPGQSRLTDWIRAGATGSAGTVTEPRSIWTKFPNAFFYAHYAEGLTMLESFFLSIRCPLQVLLIGEPLARPWAQPFSITLVSLEDGPLKGKATFFTQVWPGSAVAPPLALEYYLDGRRRDVSTPPPLLELDTTTLSDGYHELRVVALTSGRIRQQAHAVRSFEVANRGRAVILEGLRRDQNVVGPGPIILRATATGEPEQVTLLSRERLVATAEEVGRPAFAVDPAQLGAGPVSLQALAHYTDGTSVRSVPLPFTITP